MGFDLKAATDAAMSEAERTPFEFDWGTEHFSIPPVGSWPVGISTELANLTDTEPEKAGAAVLGALKDILGDQYQRFATTIPLSALPILMGEMSKAQIGGELPDLSQPPVLATTPT